VDTIPALRETDLPPLPAGRGTVYLKDGERVSGFVRLYPSWAVVDLDAPSAQGDLREALPVHEIEWVGFVDEEDQDR
jgi:hypothetical protein